MGAWSPAEAGLPGQAAPSEALSHRCLAWAGGPLRGPLPQVFGLGSVAHMVLGGKMGSYLAVNLGFGFGVTMGVYMAGNISGE